MVDKAPEAFRTISEVSGDLDLPQHVLRFWETRFAAIKPLKRGGGRRYYRPEDVDLLRGIRHLLYARGFTIKGVQKILREQGVRHVAALGGAILAGLPPPAGEESAFEDGPLAEHLEAEEAQEAPADLPGAAPPAAPPPAAPEPAAAEPLPEEVAPVAADRWWAETPGMALRALRRRGGPVDRTGLAAIARRAAALRARLAVARSTPGRT